MFYTSVVLKNKSSLDCWVYVGAIEVYYLCAGYKIKLKILSDENIYVVSSKQNIKYLGSISPDKQFFEIFFD